MADASDRKREAQYETFDGPEGEAGYADRGGVGGAGFWRPRAADRCPLRP
jgi:hypothetical protein